MVNVLALCDDPIFGVRKSTKFQLLDNQNDAHEVWEVYPFHHPEVVVCYSSDILMLRSIVGALEIANRVFALKHGNF